MTDIDFGSLDRRQLTLRPFSSLAFSRLGPNGFVLSWRELLNPLNWFHAARVRDNWRLEARYHRQCTHRCYCPTGSSFDGSIVACGFGVVWFYSHYTGQVPCVCDVAMEEWRERDEYGGEA